MSALLLAAFVVLIGSPVVATKVPPKAAIGTFSSVNYAITFTAPARTSFCPIPDDWEGTDHGTLIFLEPPRFCEGVGYPSSSRGFEPNVPRFEVYYGNAPEEYETDPPKCLRVGSLKLLGAARALCRSPDRNRLVLWSRTTYPAISMAEIVLTLVTTPGRLARDLSRFRKFAATVRTCKQFDARLKGKATRWGVGARCPKGDWH